MKSNLSNSRGSVPTELIFLIMNVNVLPVLTEDRICECCKMTEGLFTTAGGKENVRIRLFCKPEKLEGKSY